MVGAEARDRVVPVEATAKTEELGLEAVVYNRNHRLSAAAVQAAGAEAIRRRDRGTHRMSPPGLVPRIAPVQPLAQFRPDL
jgi:hypothetical protein